MKVLNVDKLSLKTYNFSKMSSETFARIDTTPVFDNLRNGILPLKGVENNLSLQICLGSMDFIDKKLSDAQEDDLSDLLTMRDLNYLAGTEDNLRFRTTTSVMEALKRHQGLIKESEEARTAEIRRQREAEYRARSSRWGRFKNLLRGSGLAATAFGVSYITGVLWYNHSTYRTEVYHQVIDTEKHLKDLGVDFLTASAEEREVILARATEVAKTYIEVRRRFNSIDDWDTLENAASGFALIMAPMAALALGAGSFSFFREAKNPSH